MYIVAANYLGSNGTHGNAFIGCRFSLLMYRTHSKTSYVCSYVASEGMHGTSSSVAEFDELCEKL